MGFFTARHRHMAEGEGTGHLENGQAIGVPATWRPAHAPSGGGQHLSPAHATPFPEARAATPPIDISRVQPPSFPPAPPQNGDDLAAQLTIAASRRRWSWLAALAVLACGLAFPGGMVLWTVGFPLCAWLFWRETKRRRVRLELSRNDPGTLWLADLSEAWGALMASQRIWRIAGAGTPRTSHERKTHAGAEEIVRREPVSATLSPPPHLSVNARVPGLIAGKRSVHFLPDRLLVRNGKQYAQMPYGRLRILASQQSFIERAFPPPSDAPHIGQTWQYVNRTGGPDKRYRDNRALPIVMYGLLEIAREGHPGWQLHISRMGTAELIARKLSAAPSQTMRSL